MALLKPAFRRAHPAQSRMAWAAGCVALFLALMWVTGVIPINPTRAALLITCPVIGLT